MFIKLLALTTTALLVPTVAEAEAGYFVCSTLKTEPMTQTKFIISNPVRGRADDAAAVTDAYTNALKAGGYMNKDLYAPASAPEPKLVIDCRVQDSEKAAKEWSAQLIAGANKNYYRASQIFFNFPAQ